MAITLSDNDLRTIGLRRTHRQPTYDARHWHDRAEELRIIAGLMRTQATATMVLELADRCDAIGDHLPRSQRSTRKNGDRIRRQSHEGPLVTHKQQS